MRVYRTGVGSTIHADSTANAAKDNDMKRARTDEENAPEYEPALEMEARSNVAHLPEAEQAVALLKAKADIRARRTHQRDAALRNNNNPSNPSNPTGKVGR